jgi:glycosyltransferase involved in cell wall biosynthesis
MYVDAERGRARADPFVGYREARLTRIPASTTKRGSALNNRRLHVVTMIDTISAGGGAELMARTIAMRLDPARFERSYWVTRITPPERRASVEDLAAAGVATYELDRASRASIWDWWPFVSFLRQHRVDVLHAHKFGSNVWAAIFGRLAAVPVVIANEHTWSYEGEPLRRLLDREVISRAADVFLAVSDQDRRRMIEIEGIEPDKIRVLPIAPWAFGLHLQSEAPIDLRKDLQIPVDADVIGAVGGLRAQKAYEVLIEASAALAAEFPQLRVLIVGRGPEEARLRCLIRQFGLEKTVSLLGPWDAARIPDFLSALNIGVNCSDYEGTPASIVEFMAAGLSVVATRVGGTADIVEDGVTGLLVDPRDAAGLARAIAELLRDPERRRRMAQHGRDRQQREFDVSVLVRRVEDLYESLWAASRRPRRTATLGARPVAER